MMVISSKSCTQYVQNLWTYWGRIESMSSLYLLEKWFVMSAFAFFYKLFAQCHAVYLFCPCVHFV